MNTKADVERIINEKVNPALAQHYGAAELSGYEDGVAYVKFTGACSTCPSARFTLEDVVRAEIMGALPDVVDVVLDTSVSEDLLDFAKKILNKEVEV
ncbi:MAG: NifU family protein [Clostridiales Family XIII bacterium]|jgi:Fe-S cluster biogenesis protein NfuA|nr:NifU family protein [Clostridiales Family XIII bacterium]